MQPCPAGTCRISAPTLTAAGWLWTSSTARPHHSMIHTTCLSWHGLHPTQPSRPEAVLQPYCWSNCTDYPARSRLPALAGMRTFAAGTSAAMGQYQPGHATVPTAATAHTSPEAAEALQWLKLQHFLMAQCMLLACSKGLLQLGALHCCMHSHQRSHSDDNRGVGEPGRNVACQNDSSIATQPVRER